MVILKAYRKLDWNLQVTKNFLKTTELEYSHATEYFLNSYSVISVLLNAESLSHDHKKKAFWFSLSTHWNVSQQSESMAKWPLLKATISPIPAFSTRPAQKESNSCRQLYSLDRTAKPLDLSDLHLYEQSIFPGLGFSLALLKGSIWVHKYKDLTVLQEISRSKKLSTRDSKPSTNIE